MTQCRFAGLRCNSSPLTMLMLHQTLAFTPGELGSHSHCKFFCKQRKLHTVTGQLHTPGLRAERVRSQHLSVIVSLSGGWPVHPWSGSSGCGRS